MGEKIFSRPNKNGNNDDHNWGNFGQFQGVAELLDSYNENVSKTGTKKRSDRIMLTAHSKALSLFPQEAKQTKTSLTASFGALLGALCL